MNTLHTMMAYIKYSVVLIILLPITGAAQNNTHRNIASARYYHMSGMLSTKHITMDIVLFSTEARCSMYYNDTLMPIDIRGTIYGNTLELFDCFLSQKETAGIFSGVITNNKYEGMWQNKSAKCAFTLYAVKDKYLPVCFLYCKDTSVNVHPHNTKNTYSLVYPYLADTHDILLSDTLNKFISDSYAFRDNNPLNMATYLMDSMKDFFTPDQYDTIDASPFIYYFYNTTSSIIYNSPDILVVAREDYMSLDAIRAHSYMRYLTWDVHAKRTIQLEDVIPHMDEQRMIKLLIDNIVPEYKIDGDTSASAREYRDLLHVIPETYYITPKGITFIYGEQELHSGNTFSVYVPFAEMGNMVIRKPWMMY